VERPIELLFPSHFQLPGRLCHAGSRRADPEGPSDPADPPELPKPLGPENPIVDEFGNDDPRYAFQLQALRQVEKHGRGILQVATGGGKSKIAKLIMARYRRLTLFLTTRGV
jgi:hypothetical protein